MNDRTCSVEGCDHPAFCRNWCRTHYNRWHRLGDVQADKPINLRSFAASDDEVCAVPDCGRPAYRRTWCRPHHQRWLSDGDVRAHVPIRTKVGPMGTVPCSIPRCPNPSRTRTWCHAHYRRWRQGGDPRAEVVLRLWGEEAETRFWRRVDRNGPIPSRRPELGRCYLWTGAVNGSGYGAFNLGGGIKGAHHAGWLLGGGEPITGGLVLDHLCAVRNCVRKSHLEPVTRRTNWQRSGHPSTRAAARSTCPAGHSFDEANTYRDGRGRRSCRRCARDRTKANRARVRAARTGTAPRLVVNDELAKRVAEVYRTAVAHGKPPVIEVAAHFAQTYCNANRLCRLARDRGVLTPSDTKVLGLRTGPREIVPQGEVVYFVERDDYIKIGTSKDLAKRLRSIRRDLIRVDGMTAGPVRLLATMPGGRTEEARLHRRFADLRAGGEWFRPDARLRALIEHLAAGAIPELALTAA